MVFRRVLVVVIAANLGLQACVNLSSTRVDDSLQYCRFSELRASTQTNLWDDRATSTSVGDRCVVLIHPVNRRPKEGSLVCVEVS